MKVRIYTLSLPLAAVLHIDTAKTIIVRGSDPEMPNTVYFEQRMPVEYINAVGKPRFNMPVVPDEYLNLEIVDEGSDRTVAELLNISCEPLKSKPVFLDNADEEYFQCARWMAQYAGVKPVGALKRGNVTFEIFDVLTDPKTGEEVSTPARVDHNTGIVQIAKRDFDKYTVPMRMFILAHERVHYVMDTTDESKADINALNICLRMGFPKMELLYAATKVFPDTPESRMRVDAMVNFINNY